MVLFMSFIRSSMITSCGCLFLFGYFNSIHCCFITVLFSTNSTAMFLRRYTLNIVVLLLFFPNIVMDIQRPNPELSCPLLITADDNLPVSARDVPPGL